MREKNRLYGMHSRVVRLVMLVCTYFMLTKNRLVSVLLLENLLLSSALLLKNLMLSVICGLLFQFKRLQCSLLRPASCTDRAIHAFPNNVFFGTLVVVSSQNENIMKIL